MAVTTPSLEKVKAHLRLTAVDTSLDTVLVDLIGVAAAKLEVEANTAPAAIQEEAIILCVGYLFDKPGTTLGTGFASAWRNSGAASLVKSWVQRTAAVIG